MRPARVHVEKRGERYGHWRRERGLQWFLNTFTRARVIALKFVIVGRRRTIRRAENNPVHPVVRRSHRDVRHGRVLSRVDVPLAVPGRSHDFAARDQPAESLLVGKSVPGSDRTPFVLYRRRWSRPLFRRNLSPETAKTLMKSIRTEASRTYIYV